MKMICKNCKLSSKLESTDYLCELWCEFHQEPKFNDDWCETFIEKGKEVADET